MPLVTFSVISLSSFFCLVKVYRSIHRSMILPFKVTLLTELVINLLVTLWTLEYKSSYIVCSAWLIFCKYISSCSSAEVFYFFLCVGMLVFAGRELHHEWQFQNGTQLMFSLQFVSNFFLSQAMYNNMLIRSVSLPLTKLTTNVVPTVSFYHFPNLIHVYKAGLGESKTMSRSGSNPCFKWAPEWGTNKNERKWRRFSSNI